MTSSGWLLQRKEQLVIWELFQLSTTVSIEVNTPLNDFRLMIELLKYRGQQAKSLDFIYGIFLSLNFIYGISFWGVGELAPFAFKVFLDMANTAPNWQRAKSEAALTPVAWSSSAWWTQNNSFHTRPLSDHLPYMSSSECDEKETFQRTLPIIKGGHGIRQ